VEAKIKDMAAKVADAKGGDEISEGIDGDEMHN